MSRISRRFGLLLVAALCFGVGLVPAVVGDEKVSKKGAKTLESKLAPTSSATKVEFAKELDLSLPMLTGLGARIEQARHAADPVGLASAARDLAVAEKVSGKTASLTSKELAKEAVELARYRDDSVELRALAEMVGGASAKGLRELAEKAKMRAAAAKKDKEEGKSRGIEGTLHVDSRVNTTLYVYVNGVYRGTVPPFGDSYFYVGDQAFATTFLRVTTAGGGAASRSVSAPNFNYTWTITP